MKARSSRQLAFSDGEQKAEGKKGGGGGSNKRRGWADLAEKFSIVDFCSWASGPHTQDPNIRRPGRPCSNDNRKKMSMMMTINLVNVIDRNPKGKRSILYMAWKSRLPLGSSTDSSYKTFELLYCHLLFLIKVPQILLPNNASSIARMLWMGIFDEN